MTQQLPPGQGPIDPRGAFGPLPPPPGGVPGAMGPMMQMPFPQFMPPPRPPRRGGIGWGIIAGVLMLLLVLSVVMNFVLGIGFAAVGALGSRGVEETTITSGSSDQQIAVIPLEGIITDSSRRNFEDVLRHLEESKTVIKGLIIDIDSPGGEVTPSDEIYEKITRIKSEHPTLPIAASIRGLGASGAYYAACGCDHIIAEQTTITGSIGVLFPNYNFAELMQKYGVKDLTIISDGAPFKDALSPTRTPDPAHDDYLKGLVNSEFSRFKAVVQQSRGSKLKPNIDDIANGKAYTATEAKANGLIDDIGYLDKAVKWVATNAHLSNPNVVRYQQKSALFDAFPFAGQQDNSRGVQLNVNGMDVQIDRKLIDALTHPRPMAIWRGR
jgi:protease-4